MKANYNRKVNVREKAVCFRKKTDEGRVLGFCVYQNTVFDRMTNDRDIVYLDCENDEQIDKLIAGLQQLKEGKTDEQTNESNSES